MSKENPEVGDAFLLKDTGDVFILNTQKSGFWFSSRGLDSSIYCWEDILPSDDVVFVGNITDGVIEFHKKIKESFGA